MWKVGIVLVIWIILWEVVVLLLFIIFIGRFFICLLLKIVVIKKIENKGKMIYDVK